VSLSFLLLWLVCGTFGRIRDSLVPLDVVEPKTGSKKKEVMQLDRDVLVRGTFLCFCKHSLL
jgi:hypothetical protein